MILCCKCHKRYAFIPLKGRLKLPIIVCPYCGFRHTVEFKAVKDSSLLLPLSELRLVTAKPILEVSRFLEADRTPLAADDTSITDYNKANEFIIVFQIDETMGPWTSTYTLMWRNVTDAGSFANIAASGEMKWGTATSLVNGTNVTSQACTNTPGGSTWQDGEEVEGAATSDSIVLADEYYTELHFAVSGADGIDGKEYAFQLYENGGGSVVGVAACTLTTSVGVTDYPEYPTPGGLLLSGVVPVVGKGVPIPVGALALATQAGRLDFGIVPGTEVNIVDRDWKETPGYVWDDDAGFVWRDS